MQDREQIERDRACVRVDDEAGGMVKALLPVGLVLVLVSYRSPAVSVCWVSLPTDRLFLGEP